VNENIPGLAFIKKLRPVTYHLDVTALSSKLNEDVSSPREVENQMNPSSEVLAARSIKEHILQTGFIAQEVETAAKEIGFDFSGIDKPKNPTDLYGLRYAEFVVPLVKGMQEQQAMIESQQSKIELLKLHNEALQANIDRIIAALQAAGIEID